MKNSESETEKSTAKTLLGIKDELRALNENLELHNSIPRKFATSVLTGLGTAIGATVIAGLVIYILLQIAEAANLLEIISNAEQIVQ